jgi:hypothetical protein
MREANPKLGSNVRECKTKFLFSQTNYITIPYIGKNVGKNFRRKS